MIRHPPAQQTFEGVDACPQGVAVLDEQFHLAIPGEGRDIVRDRVDHPLLRHRTRVPLQPGIVAIDATVAVAELDGRLPAGQPGHLGERRLPVVRVDELQEAVLKKRAFRIAEHTDEISVDPAEIARQAGDAEEVDRKIEESHQLLLGASLPRFEVGDEGVNHFAGLGWPAVGIDRQAPVGEPHQRLRTAAGIETGKGRCGVAVGRLPPGIGECPGSVRGRKGEDLTEDAPQGRTHPSVGQG